MEKGQKVGVNDMDRLTVKGFKFTRDYVASKLQSWSIAECLKKLQEYEDLEEQGLLLRLPCKVGDSIYQPINNRINEYKVIGLVYDILLKRWKFEVAYEVAGVWNKTICDLDYIGKTVFLTKEQAEAALEKMKGEEHE